jgi:hypothetical protein
MVGERTVIGGGGEESISRDGKVCQNHEEFEQSTITKRIRKKELGWKRCSTADCRVKISIAGREAMAFWQ